MVDTKINLVVALPGNVAIDKTNYSLENEESNKENLYPYKVKVNKVDKTIWLKKRIPAYQSINISRDAFDYMVKNAIEGYGTKAYIKLSIDKRVELHLTELAKALGGKIASFTIFED